VGGREDFLRELRALARKKNQLLVIDMKHGKGSHYKVRVGQRQAVVPAKIGRFIRRSVLKDLDLD
jgi:hypothetical protein